VGDYGRRLGRISPGGRRVKETADVLSEALQQSGGHVDGRVAHGGEVDGVAGAGIDDRSAGQDGLGVEDVVGQGGGETGAVRGRAGVVLVPVGSGG
jgi:hypothetical protein